MAAAMEVDHSANEADRHYFRNGSRVEPPARQAQRKSFFDAAAAAAVRNAVNSTGSECLRIFVAGAVTHIGKTTVCLSLLAALREAGFSAAELGYIKPATQCEAPDLLKQWCSDEGIEYVSGESAPLVFYSGFTRSFLAGEQGTSQQWLDRIAAKIQEMSASRRVLIVDGVGFPAVGSIVGVDNADVARVARAPVLLVCKSGVGGAVDSFSLNSTYFLSKGVPVLGALFNMGEPEGFYSWDKCASTLKQWFDQQGSRRERFYGVVPIASELKGLRERISETNKSQLRSLAFLNAEHFSKYVDLPSLLFDAACDRWCRGSAAKLPNIAATAAATKTAAAAADPPAKRPRTGENAGSSISNGGFVPKSRQEVASQAKSLGAVGGG